MLKIKKIKMSKGSVLIDYRSPTSDGTDSNKLTLESKELPSPEFKATLQLLSNCIAKIYELPEAYAEGIEVTSATFVYKGEDGTMGCTISGKKTVNTSNSPALFNTPIVYVSTDEGQDKAMDGKMEEILNDLQDCARDYINGARAQQTLFEGSEG
jgi:hypothetical protein